MISLEELTSWDTEEIAAHIRKELPPGWTFTYTWNEGWSQGTILDAESRSQWDGIHPDLKYLLFDAYGWVVLRGKSPQHPAWRRRSQREVPETPNPSGDVTVEAPDPEDLNPDEVRMVYASTLPKK